MSYFCNSRRQLCFIYLLVLPLRTSQYIFRSHTSYIGHALVCPFNPFLYYQRIFQKMFYVTLLMCHYPSIFPFHLSIQPSSFSAVPFRFRLRHTFPFLFRRLSHLLLYPYQSPRLLRHASSSFTLKFTSFQMDSTLVIVIFHSYHFTSLSHRHLSSSSGPFRSNLWPFRILDSTEIPHISEYRPNADATLINCSNFPLPFLKTDKI